MFDRCVPQTCHAVRPVPIETDPDGAHLQGCAQNVRCPSNLHDVVMVPKTGGPYVLLTLAEALREPSVSSAIDSLAKTNAVAQVPPALAPQSPISPVSPASNGTGRVAAAPPTSGFEDQIAAEFGRLAELLDSRMKIHLAEQQESLLLGIDTMLTKTALQWSEQLGPTLGMQQKTVGQEDLEAGQVFDDHEDDRDDVLRVRKTKRMMALAARGSFDISKKNCLQKFVRSLYFEFISIGLILASVLLLAVEIQFAGQGAGYRMGYRGYSEDNEEVWPRAQEAFRGFSTTFACCFAVELFFRVAAVGPRSAVKSGWIWFDGIMVVLSVLNLIDDYGLVSTLRVNASVGRLARLVRIMRILKVIKSMEVLQSLFLLIKSIQASLSACAWSLAMLLGFMTVFGMFLNQTIFEFIDDEGSPTEERQHVFEYFGTFSRLMVSMFEITLGNWIPPCRLLMETVSQSLGLAIVLYRCFLCFAVVNVINAVFITETHRVAASDDEVAILRRERTAKEFIAKLEDLFVELDADGDGKLSSKEFHTLMHDKLIKRFMGTLEIDTSDVMTLFRILDDGDGEVLKEEFINGLHAIRGTAKGINTVEILKILRKIERKVTQGKVVRMPTHNMSSFHDSDRAISSLPDPPSQWKQAFALSAGPAS